MAIFKYFTLEKYAKALVERGEMLFRPLSYFRAYEDSLSRGDPNDGLMRYSPDEGLKLKRSDGTVLNLPGWRFKSSARQDAIFVYCMSNQLSQVIADKFDSPFCVEITDPATIVRRLKARESHGSRLDYENVLFEKVDYRDLGVEPGGDWALPEKLAFTKPPEFSDQDECRLVIGRRGALDPQNVECSIEVEGNPPSPQPTLASSPLIRIGSLGGITKVHRF